MKNSAHAQRLIYCGISLFVLLATFSMPAPAKADTIDLAYKYVEAGAVIDVYRGSERFYWGSYGGDGLMNMATSNPSGSVASDFGSTIWATCMEVNQFVSFSTNTYEIHPLSAVIGPTKAAMIQQLWASSYDYFSQQHTPVFYGDTNGAWVAGEPANNVENANAMALVYSVFEIVYDYDGTLASLDPTAGQFRLGPNQSPLGPPSILQRTQDMLDGLVDPQTYFGYMPELFGLTNPSFQDVIVELRPLPEPATLGLLALGGIGLLRRRRN